MRKLLTWIAVTLGIAAVVRRLRRRGSSAEPSADTAPAGDPAEALREKLAASRAEDAGGDTAPDATSGASVDERRAGVHDEGRAALGEMRSTGDDA